MLVSVHASPPICVSVNLHSCAVLPVLGQYMPVLGHTRLRAAGGTQPCAHQGLKKSKSRGREARVTGSGREGRTGEQASGRAPGLRSQIRQLPRKEDGGTTGHLSAGPLAPRNRRGLPSGRQIRQLLLQVRSPRPQPVVTGGVTWRCWLLPTPAWACGV